MAEQNKTGWSSVLAKFVMATLVFQGVTGLIINLFQFSASSQWGVLLHSFVGIAAFVPIARFYVRYWKDYYTQSFSFTAALGHVGMTALLASAVLGIVMVFQALFGIQTSSLLRRIHPVVAIVTLGTAGPHIALIVIQNWKRDSAKSVRIYPVLSLIVALMAVSFVVILGRVNPGERYNNEFPEDYSLLYGEDRPFAPSLAQTSSGGALDPRSISGSESCGSCHAQIVEEWSVSAHRYAAMDSLFQLIQEVMATQNGPESTRYCAGCHDPISLFSGTKNVFAENLTSLQGFQEGVSCLVCHAIKETDLLGNANYILEQPNEYLWQWNADGVRGALSNFLIRVYPAEHNKLSKRMYKSPEYCAACHKQFIDEEINLVGWVQLQNQYDNWAASRWHKEGDPARTIECRECHMPLVDSFDPAAGDSADYNRTDGDGKHRSHRFIAANQFMPELLKLEGWENQVRLTEKWLQGTFEIPEIRDKWVSGPIVQIALEVPDSVSSDQEFRVRVVLTSSKVGHDYPTGPLDIIQSWVEVRVEDDDGKVIFTSGTRDERNYLEPGSFLFKAEPVDQMGNLIDRHNLWEMVGVRYRRSLFPGYSDSVEYLVRDENAGTREINAYKITAILYYRKADQFLLDFFLGEDSGITSPAVELNRIVETIEVRQGS